MKPWGMWAEDVTEFGSMIGNVLNAVMVIDVIIMSL